MAQPVELKKFQILVEPGSKKSQGLQTGDIVRRQYRDGNNIIYSLMCVLSTGTVKRTIQQTKLDEEGNPVLDENNEPVIENKRIDVPYFIGALLDGDEPKSTELLDFARITNLFDQDRSGALYLTASDDEAPYMDVIDGIGRNKSLSWPENIAGEAFEDAASQYIIRGDGLEQLYKPYEDDNNRILRLTRNSIANSFSGLSQDFYELVQPMSYVLVSYKARASREVELGAEIGNSTTDTKDAEWTETVGTDWEYHFQAIEIRNSGRHLRTFRLDLQSTLIGDWVEIADFNIILLESVVNFGEAAAIRIGKLDGIIDPVYGNLKGYGAYIERLYCSQTAHISGTLTAGDENGFASTFYAGKIHRNCFINSCNIDFTTDMGVDNTTLINPTGMGNVYKTIDQAAFSMAAQTNAWLTNHVGKRYCFSFWGYAKKPCQLQIKQNGKSMGALLIPPEQTHQWCRIHKFFDIVSPSTSSEKLVLEIVPSFYNSSYQVVADSIDPDEPVLFFTAPQLESGENCTQYQPTDDTLDETEDYGAWFARGGIGGTIQNPLLRLNYDGNGAIGTRSKSFRLNQDGSGYLANENIQWDETGKVTFGSDVTLNWDNFGEDIQEEIADHSLKIVGEDTFTVVGQQDTATGMNFNPASITLELEETGFTSTTTQRQWYVQRSTGFEPIPNANGRNFFLTPESSLWNGGSVLTLKCEVTLPTRTLSDTFTVRIQYVLGYTVVITSSKGTTFQNGTCATILTAQVYYQGQLVDIDYARSHFDFVWKRYKSSNMAEELPFTDYENPDTPEVLYLDYELDGSDVFVCELCSVDQFDYSFPVIF